VTIALHANVLALAVSDAWIYWADPGVNAVLRTPVGGGPSATFASGGGALTGGLAVAGGVVYWTAGGNLLSAPEDGDGAAPVVLAPAVPIDANRFPAALPTIVVTGGNVYWNENVVGGDKYYKGTIQSVQVGAGPEAGAPHSWSSPGQEIDGLVTDGQALYWVTAGTLVNNFFDSAVERMPLEGAPSPLAGGTPGGWSIPGLAVSGANVYWSTRDFSNSPGGTIQRGSSAGGQVTALATFPGTAWPVIADGNTLYWLNDAALVKMPLSGGTPVTWASLPSGARCLAQDATSVYVGSVGAGGSWIADDPGTGFVLKVPK
jgi:hypothetical protein